MAVSHVHTPAQQVLSQAAERLLRSAPVLRSLGYLEPSDRTVPTAIKSRSEEKFEEKLREINKYPEFDIHL